MSVFHIKDQPYIVGCTSKSLIIRTNEYIISAIVTDDPKFVNVSLNHIKRNRSGLIGLSSVMERIFDYAELELSSGIDPESDQFKLMACIANWVDRFKRAASPTKPQVICGSNPCQSCDHDHHNLCEGNCCSCNCQNLPDPSGRFPIIHQFRDSGYRVVVTGSMVGQFRTEYWDGDKWVEFLVSGDEETKDKVADDAVVREYADQMCYEMARLLQRLRKSDEN